VKGGAEIQRGSVEADDQVVAVLLQLLKQLARSAGILVAETPGLPASETVTTKPECLSDLRARFCHRDLSVVL